MTGENDKAPPARPRAIWEVIGNRIAIGLALWSALGMAMAVSAGALIEATREGVVQGPSAPWEIALLVIAAAGFMIGAGFLLSRWLHSPVEELTDRISTYSEMALRGEPVPELTVSSELGLHAKVGELERTVGGLLSALQQRHSALEDDLSKAHSTEEVLSFALEDSNEGHMVLVGEHVVVANPAAFIMIGAGPRRPGTQQRPSAMDDVELHLEDGTRIDRMAAIWMALKEPLLLRLSRPGSNERWLIVRSTRRPGPPELIHMTAIDATEEKRREKMRDEVVALVSHDLHGPLSAIIGYLDLLGRPMPDAARDHALDSAKVAAKRAEALLEDLVSAARAVEVLAPVTLLPIDLAGLAEETAASLAAAAPDRELKVVSECHPIVRGDDQRLAQAITNLLTNAFKYSPAGTPVTMTVGCHEGQARLTVQDEGPGVPEEDRDRLFDRFTRLERDRDTHPGYGLGLYIVRTIAENHGGHAGVCDSSDRGACFYVTLPIAPDDQRECAPGEEARG